MFTTNFRQRKQEHLVYAGLFLFACFTVGLCLLSQGSYDNGDSIQHYFISHYSFKHPELFLDHWGKPFFTLISSPFSFFGFKAITVFNALGATLSGLLVFRICKKLNLNNSWLGAAFTLFTPLYFVVIFSGLTEIFFSLVLLLSIWLFLEQKYIAGAAILSFLPFVRTEGFPLLPLFGLVLLFEKRWRILPLLAVGSFIYSLAGYFYYNDFLWIIHQNPYKGAAHIYGHGSLFHFASNNEFILGIPLVVLFVIGLLSYFLKGTSGEGRRSLVTRPSLLLIFGGFFVYFIAHSVFWWKGLFGSLGLIRVMAGVTPLAAIIALYGFNFLLSYIKKNNLQRATMLVIVSLVIWMPFKQHTFPRVLESQDIAIKQAAEWMKSSEYFHQKKYYLHPSFAFFLEEDPFNNPNLVNFWSLDPQKPAREMLPGEIMIWDSHFGPQEAEITLEKLIGNPQLELLKVFSTKGNSLPFEIYIFKRV